MADEFTPSTFVSQGDSAYDWISGFTKSAIQSMPELIGIHPSTDTANWRQDHPVAGFLSELAGTTVPYVGWFKAASMVPKFERAVATIGNLEKTPFVSGALQSAALFAPFEAGRLGVSQIVGDKPFSEMLGETSLNLALGAGIGGVLHGLAAGGTRSPNLRNIFGEDLDLASPLPLQARQMREIIAQKSADGTLTGDNLGRANAKLLETLRAARIEEVPSSHKYVSPIAHDQVPGADAGEIEQQLNRLFRVRENPEDSVLQTRKFAQGAEKDFKSDALWRAEASQAGLPPGFEEHGQYFRQVAFKKDAEKAAQQASTIDSKISRNMAPVGDATFMTREADDGLFVMAKKYAGDVGVGSPEDKWVLFKTDKPGLFVPDADNWAKLQVAKGKWNPQADLAQDGGSVYNLLRGFTEQFPLRNYMALAAEPKGIAGVIDGLIPKNLRGADSEIVARLGEVAKEYLAPRIFQFKKSWRANWITNATKATYDEAETLTQMLMNGRVATNPARSLFSQALTNTKQGLDGLLPVRSTVEALSEKDLNAFWEHVWRPGVPAKELQPLVDRGVISPEVRDFANNLEVVDRFNKANINKVEEAVGKSPTTWKEGHYGLSHVWEGDTRIVLTNDTGEATAIAAGANRKAAQANAAKMLQDHPEWKLGNEFSLSQFGKQGMEAIPEGLRPVVKSPSWLLERQELQGFRWDTQPFTKQEFLEAYENSLRARNGYQANLATTDVLQPQLDTLMREDPAAFRMVTARMNDFAGVQSKFGRLQNEMADKVLAPMLGTNSASKIVGITNTAMFNLQLGALKLSYPIVNALQFVQTVLPEAAFLMTAPEASIAGKYSFFAAGGTKGPVGGMGVLSPIKLMYSSMQEMRKPSAELSAAFQRAVNDRVIDPRIVEGYVGESSIAVQNLSKALGSGKDFTEWLRAVSEFLPAQTERLSRTHAFTVGYGVARDFLKNASGAPLNAEQMYSFARQFTENTMYLYSAADKPRVFTTPAGSALGLFKNWMFHYIASMGEYASQGFAQNNWSPLLWQTTGTFALGGLSATPLYWVADGFSRMWKNESVLRQAYDQFGSSGDAVMLGLPAAMTGISLYSQVNSPVANPVRDASTLFSVAAWDRVKYVGKAAGAAFDHWQATGAHPADSQGVRELLARAFAPTTVYRSIQAANDGEIRSMGTGYPIVKDVPASHRILYGLGFNPVELDRGQAVAQELQGNQERHKAQVTKLGVAWAEAQKAGRSDEMAIIMRQAMVWGLDISSVIKSGMTIQTKQSKDLVERKMKPQDIGPYMKVLNAGKE